MEGGVRGDNEMGKEDKNSRSSFLGGTRGLLLGIVIASPSQGGIGFPTVSRTFSITAH